jgi:phosphoglycerate dehydrogenase-like enzyme
MKRSAIFVNTTRGGIVDQDALYHALKVNNKKSTFNSATKMQ